MTAAHDTQALVEELDAAAERITRYSNNPLDGLLSAAARKLEELAALASRLQEQEGQPAFDADTAMGLADAYAESVRDGDDQIHQIRERANLDHYLRAEQPSASLVADILKDCCECDRPNRWDVETLELRVSDLTMILQRHIEGKE